MKKYAAILSAIFLYTHALIAQEPSEAVRTKSQFSIALLNGIGHTRYQQTFGDLSNLDRLNSTHVLMFKYRYRFSEKLYAEAAWGFGAHVENLKSPIYDFVGFDFWHYEALTHSRIDFSAAYQVYQVKNNFINAKFGLGWNRFSSLIFGSQSITQDDVYRQIFDIESKRLPFTSLGLEFVHPTKRKDELSFYLGYQYASNSFYKGFYEHFRFGEIQANGTMSSNLSALQFALAYTFTRNKRKENLAWKMTSTGATKKETKKKDRFEKRSIDPKSQYISAAIGFGVNSNRFKPKNVPFSSPNFASFATRVSYEYGWKNNIFFEVDYAGFLFWEGAKMDYTPTMSGSWGGDAFYGHFLCAGLQYKIQNPKTNFQFLNVHGGIGLGAHFLPKGEDGSGSGGGTFTSDNYSYSYNYTSISEVRGHLMPVIYGGISKDIRITERFLLNLMYKHQLGFHNVYATQYVFSDSSTPDPIKLNSKIDGTAFLVQLGFKYRMH